MSKVDFFLKLEGIEGESQDKKHKGEIEIESWSFGASQQGHSGHGTGGSAGKVALQDFHFVMNINKASPLLFQHVANGKHLKQGKLTCRKAGGNQETYLTVTFSDLIVSSFQTGASSHGGAVPVDQISLNFTKVEIQYKAQKADGTMDKAVDASWNVKTNDKA